MKKKKKTKVEDFEVSSLAHRMCSLVFIVSLEYVWDHSQRTDQRPYPIYDVIFCNDVAWTPKRWCQNMDATLLRIYTHCEDLPNEWKSDHRCKARAEQGLFVCNDVTWTPEWWRQNMAAALLRIRFVKIFEWAKERPSCKARAEQGLFVSKPSQFYLNKSREARM